MIQYNEQMWRICTDLKVTALLCGLQCRYTKTCVFCAYGMRIMSIIRNAIGNREKREKSVSKSKISSWWGVTEDDHTIHQIRNGCWHWKSVWDGSSRSVAAYIIGPIWRYLQRHGTTWCRYKLHCSNLKIIDDKRNPWKLQRGHYRACQNCRLYAAFGGRRKLH